MAQRAAVRFPSACPVLLRLGGVGPLVASAVFFFNGHILKIAKVAVHWYPICGLSPREICGGLGVAFGVCGGERRPRHEATANDAYRLEIEKPVALMPTRLLNLF